MCRPFYETFTSEGRARNLHRGVFSQIRTCRRGSIVGFAGIFMRDATAKVDAAAKGGEEALRFRSTWAASSAPPLFRPRITALSELPRIRGFNSSWRFVRCSSVFPGFPHLVIHL